MRPPAFPTTSEINIPTSPTSSSAAAAPRRWRVVMLANRINRGGGAERTMVALATHLPRERFDVTVVTTRSAEGPLLESLRSHGIRHISLNRRGRFDVAPFRRLVSLLRDEEVDVIHAHMFGSNFWATILGRIVGVPVIVAHEHTWSYQGQRVRRFIDGYVIGRLADVFIAVSERDRQRMTDLEGVPPAKIVVLPNPYVRRSMTTCGDVRASLGIGVDVPLVVTVAVLRPQKALVVLLRAFAEVLMMIPEAMLAIGGDGPCREELEREARDLGISGRVRFLGWWQDVGGLLDAADVAAMSSDYEGSPLFALECVGHMTPLVTTDVGNVAELLGAGEGVITVPARDSSALGRAIASLLRDPSRRAAQAEAAAACLPRHEIDNVAREFSELYEEFLQRARTHPRKRAKMPRIWA